MQATASKITGKPIEEMEVALKTEIEAGKNIDEAMDNVLNLFGVKGKEAIELKTTAQQLSKNIEVIPQKQAGNINPVLAASVAIPVTGGVFGYSPEHPEGAIAGAALSTAAVLGGRSIVKVSKNVIKTITKKDTRIRIDDLTNKWEGDIATGQRSTWQFKNTIDEMIPAKPRREAISHWLEGDKSIKLNRDEMKVAMSVHSYFNKLYEFAKKEGVLDAFVDNYVPHLWTQGGKAKSEIINAFTNKGGNSMSPRSPHAKDRSTKIQRCI